MAISKNKSRQQMRNNWLHPNFGYRKIEPRIAAKLLNNHSSLCKDT
jgi:hypothetical protein